MIEDHELVVELATDEELEEIEKFLQNQGKLKEQQEKKERRAKINRKIAKQKKKKSIVTNQMKLFDDF
tara:strand:+ start:48585 stop:48788 length:204 start_codon:yes stop_codon:yes gene_type:complete